MTERKWIPVTPPTHLLEIRKQRAANEFAEAYYESIGEYAGRIEKIEDGWVYVRFGDMHSATAFITWSATRHMARLEHWNDGAQFMDAVVIKFNATLK